MSIQKLHHEMHLMRKLWETNGADPTSAAVDPSAATSPAIPAKPSIGADYEKLRQQVKLTISDLQDSLEKYETRMQEFYRILGQAGLGFSASLAGKDEQIRQLQTTISEKSVEIQNLQQQHAEQVANLEGRINDLLTQHGTSSSQLQTASQELADSKASVAKINERLEEIQKKLNDEITAHAATKGSLEGEKTSHATTRADLAGEKTAHSKTTSQLAELEPLLDAQQKLIEELQAELKKLSEVETNISTGSVRKIKTKDWESPNLPDDFDAAPTSTVQNSHTQHWGEFNLREHLKRAVRKQPRKSWF